MNEKSARLINEGKNREKMKVELIIPIEGLHGKLRRDGYYFRKYRGQQIVQKCPNREGHVKTEAEASKQPKAGSRCRIKSGVNEQSNKPLKERKKKMAKITMMSGIASISGRVGNCCFRTMKATGKVYMHQVKDNSQKSRVKRPANEAMVRQRKRFSEIAKIVMQMKAEGSKKSRKQLWKIATQVYDAENQ